MIFTNESAKKEIKKLLKNYPDLSIHLESKFQIELLGNIYVNVIAKGFHLQEEYCIKIVLYIGSNRLPRVFDIGDSISSSYIHKYPTGELCLDTDASIRMRFLNGFDLKCWMQEYVETYFFSYEYAMRYGEFPFGERAHGIDGILETYQSFFGTHDRVETLRLMREISGGSYRGHMLCPCGSGRKLRDCHGGQVFRFYTNESLKQMTRTDFAEVCREIQKYDKQ